MHIEDVLHAKAATEVVTVGPETGVRELLAVLAERNIGAVVVSSPADAIAGIVSERDVVRRLHLDGTVLNNTVGAIMTSSVETCAPRDDLDAVLQTMTERRVRHLPVVDGGGLVGIVSIGDLVKHKIGQLQFERDQLDSYLHQT
ncbi:CBS domain-containing protein [Nocardioides pantholopis]|uniref:CBS domain-containing protein n=1 Tax=Nocardioides pantholopis TaxID=2483798 RepID=UPI000F0808CD|nr:CBS domain-containing protein [Nocardioides pantholopis]